MNSRRFIRCAGEHGVRHGEAARFGSLEVYHQLILRWRLHRQVGWLLTLEDAVDVAGAVPETIEHIRSVGDQTPANLVRRVGVAFGSNAFHLADRPRPALDG